MRDRFRAAIERWLPWYDHDAEARRDLRTEQIRQRSIRARIAIEGLLAEDIRDAYQAYSEALRAYRLR